MSLFSLKDSLSKMRRNHLDSYKQGEISHSRPEVAKNIPRMEQFISSKLSAFRSLPLYEDLRKQDLIRLIKLDSTADSTNKGYEVKAFSIRKLPKYYGLSYCWGSSERVTQIICNGQPLQISDHLSQGLRELRSLPEFSKKWFWIDQICVNQNDLDERSHQVKLMQKIYNGAVSTVIWLGICNEPCEKAFSLAHDIFEILQANGDISGTLGMKRKIPLLKTLDEEDLLSLNLPIISDQSWQELRTLLSKAWFRRMWIIQEVILSRKKPLLVYGGRVRNWDHVLCTSIWIRQRAPRALETFIGTGNYCYLNSLFQISSTREAWGLQELLLATQDFQSTDARDKIFSLLGIAAETQDKAMLPALLEPDYKNEVELVYRDFTSYLISKSGSLILFSMIHENKKRPLACRQEPSALPSWVPKFHDARCNTLSLRLSFDKDNNPIYQTRQRNATRDTPLLIQESKDPNTLILQGLKLETVNWTSEKLPLKEEPYVALRWCEEGACGLIPSKYQTFHDYLKPFLHVISRGGLDSNDIIPSNNDFWDYLGADGISSSNLIYFLKFLKEFGSIETENDSGHLAYCMRNYESGYHSFFITEKQVMGTGPSVMQKGDIVCVLFGGQSPLALRPCDDHYHLLGECYVSEFINGEAIDEWKANRIKEEWFPLR